MPRIDGQHLSGKSATAAVSPVTPADPPAAGGREGSQRPAGGFAAAADSRGAGRGPANRSQAAAPSKSSSCDVHLPAIADAPHEDRGSTAAVSGPTLEDITAAIDGAVAARLDSVLAAIRQAHVESVKQAHTTRNTLLGRIQQQDEEIAALRTAVAGLERALAEATRAF